MGWWKSRKKEESKIRGLSETLGHANAISSVLLVELDNSIKVIGHQHPIQFFAKTRGKDEALAIMQLIKKTTEYHEGKVEDIHEAIRVTNSLVMILWGELGRVAEEMGYTNNAFELLRAKNGNEYALKLVQYITEIGNEAGHSLTI